MKHLSISAFLIIAPYACKAMHQQPIILKKITLMPDPQQATFITDELIVLRNTRQCSLFDIDNEQEYIFTHENIDELTNLTISRSHIALSTNNTLTSYEISTGNVKFKKNYESCPFATYDMLRDQFITYSCQYPTHVYHPKKTEYLVGYSNKTIIYSYNSSDEKKSYIKNRNIKIKTTFSEYSSDGNTLAAGNCDTIFYVKHMDDTLKHIPKKNDAQFLYFTFHPNNKFLVTLSKPYEINYWNVRSNIPTHVIIQPISIAEFTPNNTNLKPHLSFSPNGEKLLITVNGQCLIIASPFISYKDLRKTKFIFALWVLQNHEDDTNSIPAEIKSLLKNALLQVYILPITQDFNRDNDKSLFRDAKHFNEL